MWYRSLYEAILIVCLVRGLLCRHSPPFWLASCAVAAILNYVRAPEIRLHPWLLVIGPIFRCLVAMEAFSLLVSRGFWPQARRLSSLLQMLSLFELGILAVMLGRTDAPLITDIGSWLKIWTAQWFGFSLLFMWLWPGLRVGYIKHALIVEGVLIIEALAAIYRFRRITWTPWHGADMWLYLAATVMVGLWAAFVPVVRRKPALQRFAQSA